MATISCHHARAALKSPACRDIDTDALLVKAGINPKLIALPMGRISDQQMTHLVQAIWQALDDEFMGFTPHPCERGAFAYMVHAVRRCETLREALTMGIQFYQLLSKDINTALIERDDMAQIQVTFADQSLDPDYFYLEFWLIIWHRLASWLCGIKIPLRSTHLVHTVTIDDQHRAELAVMFPGQLALAQPSNCLTFSRQLLNQPLIRSKTEVDIFLKHSPAQLLTIPGDDQSFQNKISRQLRANRDLPLKFPDINTLASGYHMSVQTLHRRLKQEGTSYQRIKDNLRRDLALNKLVQERLAVHEVAEIVGFSEARSFTRAFKSWTGLSPREYCKFLK
ncbi:MAG: AraC family transcriptional regulator [Cellvibrionaceae bacterium]